MYIHYTIKRSWQNNNIPEIEYYTSTFSKKLQYALVERKLKKLNNLVIWKRVLSLYSIKKIHWKEYTSSCYLLRGWNFCQSGDNKCFLYPTLKKYSNSVEQMFYLSNISQTRVFLQCRKMFYLSNISQTSFFQCRKKVYLSNNGVLLQCRTNVLFIQQWSSLTV